MRPVWGSLKTGSCTPTHLNLKRLCGGLIWVQKHLPSRGSAQHHSFKAGSLNWSLPGSCGGQLAHFENGEGGEEEPQIARVQLSDQAAVPILLKSSRKVLEIQNFAGGLGFSN